MTCKDCLHYDACLDNQVCGEFEFVTNVNYEDMKEWCGSFKNKADFVEVVRCRDCKGCWILQDGTRVCIRTLKSVEQDNFCSYGKRKEQNDVD